MPDRDTLARLAEEVGLALAPLDAALQSPESFSALMAELGWDMRVIPAPIAALGGALTALTDVLDAGEVDASSVQAALTGIRNVISGIQAIAVSPPGTFPATVDAAQFAAEFPQQLVDFLLIDYLLGQGSPWSQALHVLGVIRLEEVPATARRPGYIRRAIAWSDLARVLSDSSAVFRDAWSWGTPNFQQHDFLIAVDDLMTVLALPARVQPLDPTLRDALSGGAPGPDEIHDWALRVPVVGHPRSDMTVEVGAELFMLPATGSSQPGFALLPYAVGTSAVAVDLSDTLQLTVDAAFDMQAGVALLVTPGDPPRLLVDLTAAAAAHTTAPSRTHLAISLDSHGGSPIVLLGSLEGSHLQVGAVSVRAGARLASDNRLDVFGELAFNDAEIAVRPETGKADGFIANLLPGDGITAGFNFGVGLSTSQGIYITGSGGLEVQVPIHVTLGPIEVTSARLAIRSDSGSIPITLGATFRGDLGPLKATVEDVGLSVTLRFPPGGGNLGPLDLALGFKPPRGAALVVDAGVVTGGGYLFADPDRGEYAGVLELEIAKFLAAKAIGLITTRMPDGSPGFSLLLVLTAEFGTGLQLGYGFKLIGLGGIIGLNRSMRLDALMEGVRTGAIESVMFPRDVVANAPRILSDLKAFFPPREGTFLIGPMVKLGWGTPTLVSVALGVIIEIPGNIAIVGVLKVALPTEEQALLLLQVNFAGAIEFDRKRIYFFASLFGSRVLTMSINGEMGLLIAYGADPNFVLTVGGFHPEFAPPPLPFPSPRRVRVDVLNSDVGRISVSGYFAVTSNTAQFGAQADLFFGFSAFSIQGQVGFDALFQFSPFMFIIEVRASASLKAFGVGVFSISLRFALSGPTPWRARGSGSISFFFFEISADFDITWGEERDTVLPPVSVLPLFADELLKPDGWQVIPPAGGAPLVTLRALPEAESELVLHPLGTLSIRQRAVPLDIQVDKVGSQAAADISKLTVSPVGTALTKLSDAEEMFALGQFQNMDDAAKLARRAFERQHAGLELSPDGVAMASQRAVRRSARYEQSIIDTTIQPGEPPKSFVNYNGTLFNHFVAGSSVARSPLAAAQRTLREPAGQRLTVSGDSYVVARTLDNHAISDSFTSLALAGEDLAGRVAADPALDGTLHVIPAAEALP